MTTTWLREFVRLIHQHEQTRASWVERQKNSRALRARFEEQDDHGPLRYIKKWVRGYN